MVIETKYGKNRHKIPHYGKRKGVYRFNGDGTVTIMPNLITVDEKPIIDYLAKARKKEVERNAADEHI